MISANNTSYISYKNNNTSIISNSKIEKNIINRVLNNGIRANTPSNYINDKDSDNPNKEKDVKTFSIILNTDKTNKSNFSKIHSKSLDKTNVKVKKIHFHYKDKVLHIILNQFIILIQQEKIIYIQVIKVLQI